MDYDSETSFQEMGLVGRWSDLIVNCVLIVVCDQRDSLLTVVFYLIWWFTDVYRLPQHPIRTIVPQSFLRPSSPLVVGARNNHGQKYNFVIQL